MSDKETVVDAPFISLPSDVTTPNDASPKATCREIERTLSREPGDHIKCAHLFGSYYRCNWWARQAVPTTRATHLSSWAAELDDHVRKSSFLKVTMAGGKLTVEEVKPGDVRPGND
jgi:hypothetical protein